MFLSLSPSPVPRPLSPVPAEEDRRGRVRGDLRGPGPAYSGERGAEGGVGPAA